MTEQKLMEHIGQTVVNLWQVADSLALANQKLAELAQAKKEIGDAKEQSTRDRSGLGHPDEGI